MAVTVTIASVNKTSSVVGSSLRVSKDDVVEICSFRTFSRDLTSSAYRPVVGSTVRIDQDGSLLFGGIIDEVVDRASNELNAGATEVECRATGYHALPQRVLVTAAYAAGEGAYAVYADLCSLLTTYYGVTNIGTLTGGVSLPAITWDHVPVSEALNQLNTITAGLGVAMYWRINGDKQFAAAELGTDSGQTFTAANAMVIRSFSWTKSQATTLTRVWVKVGQSGMGGTARTQTWTGNGSRVNFYLDVAPSLTPTGVYENSTPYAVPSATWTYEATRNRLVRATPLGAGVTLSCTYTIYYPAYCRAETEAQIDAGNLTEAVYDYPDVVDLNQGVQLAAGHLSQQSSSPKRIRLQTRVVNIYPLELCTCTFSDRLISGSYLVRSVNISAIQGLSALLYEVELWETTALGGTWLDWWRERMTTGGGASYVTTGSGGGSPSNTIVQGIGMAYLGGSRVTAVQTGAATYVAHPEYVDVVLDSTKVPATVTLDIHCWTTNGGVSVTPRIVSGTGTWADEQTQVTGTAETATTATYQQLIVPVRTGIYAYRLKLAASAANTDVFAAGAVMRW